MQLWKEQTGLFSICQENQFRRRTTLNSKPSKARENHITVIPIKSLQFTDNKEEKCMESHDRPCPYGGGGYVFKKMYIFIIIIILTINKKRLF